jgi:hypothetical protein
MFIFIVAQCNKILNLFSNQLIRILMIIEITIKMTMILLIIIIIILDGPDCCATQLSFQPNFCVNLSWRNIKAAAPANF